MPVKDAQRVVAIVPSILVLCTLHLQPIPARIKQPYGWTEIAIPASQDFQAKEA